MFILHSSNKTENLVAHLTAVLANAPLESPFAKEVFLIQSQGMERWLSQQLASAFKVWGNYQFLFPGKFFSTLAESIDSQLTDTAFDRQLMLWRLESLLRELDNETFKAIQYYLSGNNSGLKRYQLAQQLSQIFDQYQLMRPDMLALWQQGKLLYHTDTERWQQALWLRIIEKTGGQHRGALWQEVITKLQNAPEGLFSAALPERISVFGLHTLSPLFLQYLQGLARHCQLHFYLLNPAETFWADLPGKRQRLIDDTANGHPLLSVLGQQGREFQEMLLDYEIAFELELDSFEAVDVESNLQQLQNDILSNRLESTPTGLIEPLHKDHSLSIHACHSRLREVEVLRDLLLHALETDHNLELRDIVVMAPDIQDYEPFISAIFADIQHAIADRSLRLSNHALDAFIRFLELSQSRFGWQSVLDLLEQTVVYPGFGLSETDLDLLKFWVQDTHVRWGKSAQHRAELGLPALSENTWEAMLERLLMGYAVSNDADFIDSVLPYRDIEGSSALALGGLCEFLSTLFKASNDFKQAKPLKAWSKQFYYYADQLLKASDPVERQQLNEVLEGLSGDIADVHEDDVEFAVMISWLEGMVSERKSANGFLRGQLTFCSMLPMRSIPFKVIALLGINDGEFPKVDRQPTFDLLSQHFRKGDRSRRADDRYQFLEILLSARQQLIISYIGQSISNNEAIPPSMVISELLEVLAEHYQLTDLVIKHPLQAFSSRYFDGLSNLFSFSASHCETAKSLANRNRQTLDTPQAWWQGTVAEPHDLTENIIEINDLFNFFRHPQKYFLNRQLDLRFTSINIEAEEREPFAIAGLDAYSIAHDWIAAQLSEAPLTVQKLQAQGRWLSGTPGELTFARQQAAITAFVERIKAKNLGLAIEDLPVDLSIGQYRLVGKLGNCYQHGSLFYRYATLKGKDFICACLYHLLINQLQQQTTYLISSDEDLLLLSKDCQPELLPGFIDIYQQGQHQPDAFFVEAAFAYVQQAYRLERGTRSTKSALDVAKEQLFNSLQQGFEPELRRLYAGCDLDFVLAGPFEQHCRELLQPLWNAAQQSS